ncbi:polysulfide reductase NrfD [Pyxidicoccus parkwayensis]|uniref:Polysulfide reductase NrfD n=1 Tax=Pyxidicoccus parkwayensis TaxID=2813578 RepID=A0ABX7P1E7_9BACT|nr:NrfD/PsrC family molybdoenzyme membrane anchor subunit [Pyxidicoccus parkwaysis]QSQ23716.1 polysulfide reductase NrfD [Pyxidicoccus parkwaysis]
MKSLEEGGTRLEQLERAHDGRNINPRRGVLAGEAAGQEVKDLAKAHPVPTLLTTIPSRSGPAQDAPSYYGVPAIKAPVWLPTIPLYFYVGGLAGAASALGAALELLGGRELETLGRRCRWVGFAGDVVGSGLLIEDLGRPARFLNMLRMFRPTSPMNMGAWILSVSGAMNTLAVGAPLLRREGGVVERLGIGASRVAGMSRRRGGALEALGTGASVVAGVLGLPLAGYTAVLLSNTAIPVWQRTRRTLPFMFMASGMASAAGLLQLLPEDSERERRVVRRFGLLGKVGELAAEVAVERELSRSEEVSRHLKQGRAGTLWKAARLCTAASLVLDLLPGRQRWKQVASGVLGTAGAVATRYAIYDAGKVSSKDPHATFVPQRQGLGAAEVAKNTVASDGKPLRFPLPVVS